MGRLVVEREEEGEKMRKRLRRKGKRKKGKRGERERWRTTIGKWKRNDLERGSGRTGTRDPTSSPFSPFTYTPPPGNGIANPTTLHASWQLVISRPVPRQHTPCYVSPTASHPSNHALSLSLSRHFNRSTLPSILSVCSIHAEHKSQGLELILLTLAWTWAVKRKEEERSRCWSLRLFRSGRCCGASHSVIFSLGDFGCPSTTRIRGIRQGLGERLLNRHLDVNEVSTLRVCQPLSVERRGLGSFPVARSLIRTVVPELAIDLDTLFAPHTLFPLFWLQSDFEDSFVSPSNSITSNRFQLRVNDGWKFEKGRKNGKKGREMVGIKAEGERKV